MCMAQICIYCIFIIKSATYSEVEGIINSTRDAMIWTRSWRSLQLYIWQKTSYDIHWHLRCYYLVHIHDSPMYVCYCLRFYTTWLCLIMKYILHIFCLIEQTTSMYIYIPSLDNILLAHTWIFVLMHVCTCVCMYISECILQDKTTNDANLNWFVKSFQMTHLFCDWRKFIYSGCKLSLVGY